jgi:hypothetical protein
VIQSRFSFNIDRKSPTHGTLAKRASELRDILGLAKCSSLLSRALAQQSTDTTHNYPIDKRPTRSTSGRTLSTLRAEAAEWTPSAGTETPHNYKKSLHLGPNSDKTACDTETKTLLPPFMEHPSVMTPVLHPRTFYLSPDITKSEQADLTGDGKQFISSLGAKRDTSPPLVQQKPITPPNKTSTFPPSLTLAPKQQSHSFALNASLLPQTFSVHLLSTLHIRFQHVSAALEMIDSCFANEISRTGVTQPPVSARWETWMSPAGTAGMTHALTELRKSLDELCGATARAGWIVDTWGAYQYGMLDGPKQSEMSLGSAAINGVEIGAEAEVKKGVQAPIGRPSIQKGKAFVSSLEKGEIQNWERARGVSNDKVVPALPNVGTLRPPPGLLFPASPSAVSRQPSPQLTNGNKHFPFGPATTTLRETTNGEVGKLPDMTDKNRVKRPDNPMLK